MIAIFWNVFWLSLIFGSVISIFVVMYREKKMRQAAMQAMQTPAPEGFDDEADNEEPNDGFPPEDIPDSFESFESKSR